MFHSPNYPQNSTGYLIVIQFLHQTTSHKSNVYWNLSIVDKVNLLSHFSITIFAPVVHYASQKEVKRVGK